MKPNIQGGQQQWQLERQRYTKTENLRIFLFFFLDLKSQNFIPNYLPISTFFFFFFLIFFNNKWVLVVFFKNSLKWLMAYKQIKQVYIVKHYIEINGAVKCKRQSNKLKKKTEIIFNLKLSKNFVAKTMYRCLINTKWNENSCFYRQIKKKIN